MTRAEIVVDHDAIRHNIGVLRAAVGSGVRLMAVVKADGYGHGMVEVARTARAAGADWLGVATIDEALGLRAAGDEGPLLTWLAVPGEPYAEAIARGVDLTAYSIRELDEIVGQVTTRPARVQLKVDTGLSRGGATPTDWPDLVTAAAKAQADGHIEVTGLWSHFACADEPDHPANGEQQRAFDAALATGEQAGLRPEVRHLANSAATLLRPSSHYDLVRCGIAVYGLSPAPGHTDDRGLRPAMTVRAELALAKPIAAGAGVSYGHRWIAPAPTTVGVVPAGYAEGLPRAAGDRAEVLVAGRRAPIRGRVCMDQVVVDLGGDEPAPGTEVLVFGPGDRGEPTAQEWAEACDTITYEIVTRIGGRLARRHVHEQEG